MFAVTLDVSSSHFVSLELMFRATSAIWHSSELRPLDRVISASWNCVLAPSAKLHASRSSPSCVSIAKRCLSSLESVLSVYAAILNTDASYFPQIFLIGFRTSFEFGYLPINWAPNSSLAVIVMGYDVVLLCGRLLSDQCLSTP